jgi:hypothetical protein
MKRIFSSLILVFMLVFMLTACGSSDQAAPALYELFDNYDYSTFPSGTPWSYYTRTSDPWIGTTAPDINYWSIAGNQVNLYTGQPYPPYPGPGFYVNSAFINNNYDREPAGIDSTVTAKMTINKDVITDIDGNVIGVEQPGNLGLILRADDASSKHYAFIYYVGIGVGTIEIQKVNAAGVITHLTGTYPIEIPVGFDPTALHTYRFSISGSGTSTVTLTGYIDSVLYVTVVDPGSVYTSGKTGFFLGNARTGSVSRFFIWEP